MRRRGAAVDRYVAVSLGGSLWSSMAESATYSHKLRCRGQESRNLWPTHAETNTERHENHGPTAAATWRLGTNQRDCTVRPEQPDGSHAANEVPGRVVRSSDVCSQH